MKTQVSKIVLAVLLVASVGLLFPAVVSLLPGVVAQDIPELWLTSADPPEGSSSVMFSPPDQSQRSANQPDTSLHAEVNQTLISHRITGSALRPRTSVANFGVNSNGSCIYAVDNPFDVMNIAVWLPQGSTIDTLRMFYNDTSASNSTAWFTVYDLYGVIVQEWPVSTTGNVGFSFNDTAQIGHVIDYSVYSYVINWRPAVAGTTMQLCGFRIFYEAPPFGLQFLPSVYKE